MRELSIEEKARRYDEVIERVKKMLLGCTPEKNGFVTIYPDEIFPELKESEGEKWIPKEIAKYLKEKGGFRSCWIAWLEKQGKQKPADKVEPKFHEGDIMLPKNLLEKIISGEKEFEMRKCLPKHMRIGEDGFFVVEKGTDDIRCWCRVDEVRETHIDHYSAGWFASRLCVSEEYIEKYANSGKVYLWKIGKIIALKGLKRDSLIVDRNPQQFAYCPLSYGESY